MDKSADAKSKYLTLDATDQTHAALSGYAGRIAQLLSQPAAQANPDLAGSLDDFLGAVYALLQAKQHGFADRTGPIQIAAVEKRAQKIASGNVRTDGKWIAGFYFNNALFRTAASYHRVLKIIVGKNAYVPVLLPKAQALNQNLSDINQGFRSTSRSSKSNLWDHAVLVDLLDFLRASEQFLHFLPSVGFGFDVADF